MVLGFQSTSRFIATFLSQRKQTMKVASCQQKCSRVPKQHIKYPSLIPPYPRVHTERQKKPTMRVHLPVMRQRQISLSGWWGVPTFAVGVNSRPSTLPMPPWHKHGSAISFLPKSPYNPEKQLLTTSVWWRSPLPPALPPTDTSQNVFKYSLPFTLFSRFNSFK